MNWIKKIFLGSLLSIFALTSVGYAAPKKLKKSEVRKSFKNWENNIDKAVLLGYREHTILPTGYSAPFMVDADNDGKMDIVGGMKGGFVLLFINDIDDGFSSWSEPVYLGDSFYDIDFGDHATVIMEDVDLDGLLEIVVGNEAGEVFVVDVRSYFPFEYTVFPVLADDEHLVVESGYAAPAIGDIDADGLKDLLVGSGDGKIHVYKNIGELGAPLLTHLGTLSMDVGSMAAPAAADINEDGYLDLAVGNEKGEVIVCEGTKGQSKIRNTGSDGEGNLPKTNGPCWTLDMTSLTEGNTKPTLGDLDNDGKTDLVIGTKEGKVIWIP